MDKKGSIANIHKMQILVNIFAIFLLTGVHIYAIIRSVAK